MIVRVHSTLDIYNNAEMTTLPTGIFDELSLRNVSLFPTNASHLAESICVHLTLRSLMLWRVLLIYMCKLVHSGYCIDFQWEVWRSQNKKSWLWIVENYDVHDWAWLGQFGIYNSIQLELHHDLMRVNVDTDKDSEICWPRSSLDSQQFASRWQHTNDLRSVLGLTKNWPILSRAFNKMCFRCWVEWSCLRCVAGKYKVASGSAACTNCGPGQYSTVVGATSNSCQNCKANSNSPVGSAYCICNAGFSGLGTAQDPDGGTCTSCIAGKYKIAPADSACSNCEYGKYSTAVGATSDTCENCPANSNTPAVASDEEIDCICNSGSTGPNGNTCSQCATGTYKAATGNAVCNACPENSNSPLESTATTDCKCNAGYNGPDGGDCNACAMGKYKANTGYSATGCDDCASGKYLDTPGNNAEADCLTCPVNSGNNPAASTAESDCTCVAGTTGPNGGTCSQCAAGTHKAAPGTAVCDACPANSNSPVQSTSSTACKCNTGYNGPDGGDCTTCAMGRYKANTGYSATGCDDCESGKYLDTSGNDEESDCLACPVYSGNNPAASTAQSDCTCDFGYHGPDAGPCAICVAGRYKDVTGSGTCINCVAGKYSSALGATHAGTCMDCEAGKYLQTPGNDDISDCVSTHIHTHAHTRIHWINVCIYMRMCDAYKYVHTWISIQKCLQKIYIYIHICKYIYIHVPHTKDSCQTHERVMSHIWMQMECAADTYAVNTGEGFCVSELIFRCPSFPCVYCKDRMPQTYSISNHFFRFYVVSDMSREIHLATIKHELEWLPVQLGHRVGGGDKRRALPWLSTWQIQGHTGEYSLYQLSWKCYIAGSQ